ncbi:hypothetical protein COOONC_14825 [Cooperia oncophora]
MVWAFQPQKRPTAKEIVVVMESLHDQLKRHVPPDELHLSRPTQNKNDKGEEDDKWLEEQEDLASYDPSEEQNRLHNGIEASTSRACSNGSLDGKSIDGVGISTIRASPSLSSISRAVSSITDSVDRLANAFNSNMKHDEFVTSIRVELTESLIGNDMRQMGKVVQQVVDNINNPSYHVYRREVVRIAKELATNCTNFLALFENRNRAQLPDFRAVLSDC